MRRRKFLGAVGGLASLGLAGCVEQDGEEEGEDMQTEARPTVSNPPKSVEEVKSLAIAVKKRVTEYYPDAEVYISPDERIITVWIAPNATTPDELTKEFNRLAVAFVSVIKEGDFEPATLSVVASEVRALAVESAVRAHVNGEINQEAFLKTIETMSIDLESTKGTASE